MEKSGQFRSFTVCFLHQILLEWWEQEDRERNIRKIERDEK
jgi:hypothetical protein